VIYYQKDPSAKLLTSFPPPFKGTWKTLPSYLLPADAVQDSMNVTLRSGVLRARAGLVLVNRSDLGAPVLGSFLTVDTNNVKSALIGTPEKVYRFINNDWVDITNGHAFFPGIEQVRFASLQLGTQVFVAVANGVNAVRIIPQANYLLQDIVPLSAPIPVLTDICTSFSRFVGIAPPYTVAWCDIINDSYLSFTNWPALNQAILADTEDSVVAIRPLGTLGLAVYKEGNIFVGIAQPGSNALAFRFEHKGAYEGPGGVQALVDVDGAHVRMTPTGRVGYFDGSQHRWLCDGLWPFIRDEIEPAYAHRIFGVYNYNTAEVYFWYPTRTSNGLLSRMLMIDLPYALAGVQDYSYFLGESLFPCTNGLSSKRFLSALNPLIFGGPHNRTFILDKDTLTDDGFSYQCSFRTGLYKPGASQDDQDIYFPTVELYATRGELDAGLVEVSILTSNLLEDEGDPSRRTIIDLTQTPLNEFIGYDNPGAFLGIQCSWLSGDKFEYKGVDLYGRATT
jgi:hypothetical protein